MADYALGVDLQTAAFRRAIATPEFIELITSNVIGTDADDSAPDAEKIASAWVFQGFAKEGKPYRDVEGSSRAAVTFVSRTQWTGANSHNTAKFPQLQAFIYADSTRNDDGAEAAPDALRRALAVLKVVDRIFHLPYNRVSDQTWPGMTVHSSLSAGTFSTDDVPNTQELVVRVEQRYNTMTDELIN